MERIVIDSGVEEFEVADKFGTVYGVVRFNPSDVNIISRYNKVAEMLEHIADEVAEDADIEVANDIANKKSREAIDYLFGAPVADIFFAVASPLAPLANGDLYIDCILSMLAEKVEAHTGQRMKKVRAKIEKYTAKYAPQNRQQRRHNG